MQPDCEPKPRSRKLAGRTQIEADRKRLRAASGHGRPESSSGPPRTRDAARPWRSVSRKAHTKRARRSADTSSSTRSVTSTGQCAAAAGRPELDAGLPRLAPTAGLPGVALSGLPRPRLACVPGTTFPLHGVSPLWSCTGKKATRNYCICQQYSAGCPREHRSPPYGTRPSSKPVWGCQRCCRSARAKMPRAGSAGRCGALVARNQTSPFSTWRAV